MKWNTSNSSVAYEKNNEGVIYANGVGTAIITIENYSGYDASCKIIVTPPDPIKVTSITLNKTSLSLETGKSETLKATVKPDNATNKTVTWTSNQTSVATVDGNGKVTAVAAGTATITCTANDGSGVKATCSVTVTSTDIKVNSITLNKTSLSLETGKSETLKATVKPDNATNKTVTWTSSDKSVATVDDNGNVTAKAKGSATITCKANDGSGKQATCSVTVTDPIIDPIAITISPSSKTINVGDKFYASYTLTPSNATTTVTWSSDNTSIATVTQSGLVTGVAAGSTYINVGTANGKFAYFKITVNPAPVPVENISLWWSTTVHLNDTKKLTPTITPSDANPTLTWKSSDESVATVDQDGTVHGNKIGTATISVTTDNGKSDWCYIKVVKVFTAKTAEGKTMTFQILSEEDKTCQAGEDYSMIDLSWYQVTTRAVPWGTSGAVTIPRTAGDYTVTAIGGLGFLNLRSITSVNIPNTVISLGYSAFEGCTSLSSIDLPNSITSLSSSLFYGDIALKSIEIPSSVTEINYEAFYGTGLEEVDIPSSVTKIGSSAFGNCMSLTKVTSMITEPFAIYKSVFENEVDEVTSFTNATLYVPKGTKSAYESTDGWKEFSTIIEMNGGLKGDVNEDGSVNGTDLVALTNIILGKSAEKPSADVNGDGYVNGTDYVALANIILGKSNARRMTADGTITGGTATLHIEPFDIRPGETREMAVSLSNPDDALTLLQFDLQLPQGLTVERDVDGFVVDIAGRTSRNSHQLCAYGDGGNVRFLLASAGNELIDATEGTVIHMRVAADAGFSGGIITLHDILGVSPDEQEVAMPDCQYAIAGGTDGIYSISDAQKGAAVYSLSGQRLHSVQKGINIINGKKVIKK